MLVAKRRQRSVDLDYRCYRLTVDKVCNRDQRWPIHFNLGAWDTKEFEGALDGVAKKDRRSFKDP